MRYLTVAEAKRLLNACNPDFRTLTQAALVTGARYDELAALRQPITNPDSATVQVRASKSGKGRHIVLNDEGAALFKSLAAGKPGDTLLLVKADSLPWGKSHQARPMTDACVRAKESSPRHRFMFCATRGLRSRSWRVLRSWWSPAISATPIRVWWSAITATLPSYIADAIRAAAPKFDITPDRKVVSIGARG